MTGGESPRFEWRRDSRDGRLGAYACRIGDWQLEGEWLLDHRVSDCGRYLALIAFAEAPAVPHRLCVADLQRRILLEFAQRPLIAGLLDFRAGVLSLACIVGRLGRDERDTALHRYDQAAPAAEQAAGFVERDEHSRLYQRRLALRVAADGLQALQGWRLVERPQVANADGDFILPAPGGRDAAWLFGAQSDLARDAAARLDRRAARLARQVLAVDRYGLMERFVGDYVRENPADGEMEGSNTTLAWIEFLRANGIEHAYATGSIAEVLADVNDRVSGQTQQLANSVGWSKDLIAMQLQQDSMRLEVGARLDSLERNFTRIVVVAEHLPEISDKVLEELNKQVTQLIYTMNYSLDNAFANFDRQRDELQRYVTAERQALVDQLRESADGVVQRTLDAVPGLVGKVLLYVVLALVVLIGGPFALGFWLGGVRERGRRKREKGA